MKQDDTYMRDAIPGSQLGWTAIRRSAFVLTWLLLAVCCDIQAQNQQANLAKYWTYRQRLRDRFILVSQNAEAKGTNLPASNVNLETNSVAWDDGNGGISHYLSMLATEYWLLKNNEEDVTQTAKELLYAMWAIERLDRGSEFVWRDTRSNPGYTLVGDVNGMHIRDDVSQGFWTANSGHFPVANFNSVYEGDRDIAPHEEISQDNIYHHLEGLSLVDKLTGIYKFSWDQLPPNYSSSQIYLYLRNVYAITLDFDGYYYVNFSTWAKDIVKRYAHWMQVGSKTYDFGIFGSITDHWYLTNSVTGQGVREGNGATGFDVSLGVCYNVGFLRTAGRITGNANIREQNPFLISVQTANNVFDDLFNLGSGANVDIPWPAFAGRPNIHATELFDDYKLRSLAMNGNGNNGFTFNQLRILRDAAAVFSYEHFPLMFTTLYDATNVNFPVDGWMYNQDKAIIEPLMNVAPAGGPKTNGVHQWSSDSRLVWPEKLGERSGNNIELVGLDYMLMHNLYYIAFRREDFNKLIIPTGLAETYAYSYNTWQAGRIEASNTMQSNANAIYIGRKSIRLLPGFRAMTGTTFSAKIAGKANNYNGGLYIKPAQSGGRIAGPDGGSPFDDMISNINSEESLLERPNLNTIVYLGPPTETGSLEKSGLLRVYPNPAGSDLNVAIYKEFESGEGDVKILDIQGRELISQSLQPGVGIVDLRGLTNGIYMVKVRVGSDVVTSKMTVMK